MVAPDCCRMARPGDAAGEKRSEPSHHRLLRLYRKRRTMRRSRLRGTDWLRCARPHPVLEKAVALRFVVRASARIFFSYRRYGLKPALRTKMIWLLKRAVIGLGVLVGRARRLRP